MKKYIRVDGRWRFVPVQWIHAAPRPKMIVVGGNPVKHSAEGTFYLDWRENGRRVQRPCGKSPREALAAWRARTAVNLQPTAVSAREAETDGRATVDDAIASFLRGIRGTKAPATQKAYGRDLKWFRAHCAKTFVAEVGREDVLDLFAAGRADGGNQKTINRRVMVAMMALRREGCTAKLEKGEWPRTSDPEVEVYEAEELTAFFEACTADERLLFQTFLASGMRAREVATLYWSDVDYRAHTLTVREKPELGFRPKNYEERSVTVPLSLMEAFRVQERSSRSRLVFPTLPHPLRKNYGGDAPDAHHLELCKAIAYRAGLNCRRCFDSRGRRCADGPTCERWRLHKWRATYATEHLRSGMDLETLRRELAHKDLQSTRRYLIKLHQSKVRLAVEASSIAALIA